MCGIAGIVTNQLERSDAVTRVTAMQTALQHRGPDGDGHYQSANTSTSLAHSRLSIIDLSDTGRQPMASDDQRYWITYNGEIYNYRSLKKSLIKAGETFQSESDTEIILKLYQRHGSDCVHHLRGMFAFLIWDEITETAFAARDPLGIKPFYYCQSGNNLAFASELRSLLKSGLCDESLDPDGLESYLKRGTVSEPSTLVNNAQLLPAGSTLEWKKGSVSQQQYWSLEFSNTITCEPKAIELTRKALFDSVRAHFVSDVPVGIFLSGGIDSTALVAIAKQVTDKPINTYSIAFDDPQWNEGDIAKRVAKHFGTNHTELVMTPELAAPLFDSFLKSIDQPTIDGFNTYCVSKLAHDHGAKVVLSGLGADELFAGYKSFQTLPKTMTWLNKLSLLAPVFKCISTTCNKVLSAKLRRAMDAACAPHSLIQAHQSLRGVFSNTETSALKSVIITKEGRDTHASHHQHNQSIANAISELELTIYMRNQLLRDSDVMSMAWGLELRVPFVDKTLIDTISTISDELRLNQGKKLLLAAIPEIPDWVSNRPKQGFRFPFDEWFSKHWKSIAPSTNVPTWIKLSPWYRRWNLVVFERWVKMYLPNYQQGRNKKYEVEK